MIRDASGRVVERGVYKGQSSGVFWLYVTRRNVPLQQVSAGGGNGHRPGGESDHQNHVLAGGRQSGGSETLVFHDLEAALDGRPAPLPVERD